MSKFEQGLRVVVIDKDTNQFKRGEILKIFEGVNVVIVKFDNGDVEKVPFDKLGFELEEVNQAEPITEPVENSEITITLKEFKKKCVDIIVDNSEQLRPIVELSLIWFTAELQKALFLDTVDND